MKTADPSSITARLWSAPYPLLTVVALFWAGNSIVGRAVRDIIPPITLTCGRWIIALAILLPFAWRHLRTDRALILAHWRILLLLGALGIGTFSVILYTGLRYTTATSGLLMQSAQPPLILLTTFLFHRERATLRQIAAVATSLAGVVVVVAQGDIAVLLHLRPNIGDAIVLLAVLVWAMYMVLLPSRPPVHPLSFLAVSFSVGVGCTLPLAARELGSGGVFVPGPAMAAAFLYVGIFPSLIAYLLFNRSVELIGASRASQYLNLMPLFGAGLAVLLLDEPLRLYHLAGMILILAGIALYSPASAVAPPLPPRRFEP